MKIRITSNKSIPISIPPCSADILPNYMNSWIPTVSLEEMSKKDYDVIIVGSGAGGGAVLWRLCKKWRELGKRIGMIEAGDALLPTHASNIATMNDERIGTYFANPNISEPIGENLPDFSGARLFTVLGGRTLLWSAVCPRLHPSEFNEWPIQKQEMDLYYKIAEEAMSVTSLYTKNSSYTEVLLNRLRTNGFAEAIPLPVAANLQATQYGEIQSNVFFSSIVFLGRALNYRTFDLAVKSRAVQILTQENRVTGVKVMSVDKKPYILKAKNVILSTSTLQTPRLLLHSGIFGKAIGHYLINHARITANGMIRRKEFPEILGALGILIPYSQEKPYQIQMSGNFWNQEKENRLEDELRVDFAGFGKVISRYENRVYLNPYRLDEYGVPEIQVNFSYSEQDKEIIPQMAENLKRVSSTLGVKLTSKDSMPDICLVPPGGPNHDSGTCRIGDDPSTSATNRYGQIHGISGLYVADSSVLPSGGAANPALTIVALAIRTADYIANQG
ncbi:GMC family oxidoreductase [Ectobacillus funiculus]|uniref:GMC oxidoreductase n=1 Tax=Ectobacillus funiculus TaxID=137993 RepID=UPI00397B4BFC